MITDRISLNLLYIYLKRIEANEGPIKDIIISHRSNREDRIEKTLPRFENLTQIWNFINKETSPGGFNNIHMCYEMIGAMSYVSGRTIILPPPGYCLFLSEKYDIYKLF